MNRIITACFLLIVTQQALSQTLKAFCKDRTTGGTGNGQKCASSYTFAGVTYNNECTRAQYSQYWCSTTEGEYAGKWGICESENCPAFCSDKTDRGSAGGAACVFPFSYNGVTYNSCTDLDHYTRWCSTQTQYSDGSWGNCLYDEACAPPYCTSRTQGGTADGDPCVVPFKYKGVTYTECTTKDHTGLWCATEAEFKTKWGNCLPKDCKKFCTDRTAGGSANGAPCVLPFSYNFKSYAKCTGVDNGGTPWCATAGRYDGGWGRCVYEC